MPQDTMTPGDRRELRAVVRTRIKVLRADVKQREAELRAEAEARLVERYRAQDEVRAALNDRVQEIVNQARNDITDAIVDVTDADRDAIVRRPPSVRVTLPELSTGDRTQFHRALIAGINAQVQAAQHQLDRAEAELLKTLAVSGLQSDAAREFLARIPTVAELVPATRLRQIEAEFDGTTQEG